MTNQNLTKLLIKIYDKDSDNQKWVHLCYIPEEIYNPYKEKHPEDLADMNSTLARWAEEDFNMVRPIATAADLEEIKIAVKNFCKDTYPDIYLEQSTDRQGWLRVWITKKMKEGLKIDGE